MTTQRILDHGTRVGSRGDLLLAAPGVVGMDGENLERILTGLVAGGFRGSEQRLLLTARKRLRTAEWHLNEASRYRDHALASRRPEFQQLWTVKAQVSEIRSAERRCTITRDVRTIAIALAPSWRGSTGDLLFAAAAVLAP